MGVFVAVLLVALGIIPALDGEVSRRPPVLQSPLFTIHVMAMLFAYASFALACVLGLTYVLMFNEIKAKHLGFFYARLPPLGVLDVMNGRAVAVGWVFLTIGRDRRRRLGDRRSRARRIRAPRRCRSPIPRSSSRSSAGGCTPSRSTRAARSAGAAGARRWLSAVGFVDRAAQLRADRLFPHEEPQLLTCVSSRSG